MKQIVNGKLYNTETATVVTSDRFWDGHNWERQGRNTYLFKTNKGAFFLLRETPRKGEWDYIEPVGIPEAKTWFEKLPAVAMDYFQAFGEEPEEA